MNNLFNRLNPVFNDYSAIPGYYPLSISQLSIINCILEIQKTEFKGIFIFAVI